MSNVLPEEKRVRVLAALLDGNSTRAIERMTDVHQRTVRRLLLKLGRGAVRLHDGLVRDLRTTLVQFDEIWSYGQKKESRVTAADPPGVGEAYTFAAIDALSRLVIAWRVGKRDQETCDAFMSDVRARLLVMPQITSDGFAPYIRSVWAEFGPGVDYMQTIKNYGRGGQRDDDHRYEPPRPEPGRPFITKATVFGAPNPKHASTAYIERLNGTTRHTNGRMRRLCYAFSKRPEHHRAAVALDYVGYNLCHVVRTLRVTPAMQAGVTDHVWSVEELLHALLTEAEVEDARERPTAQPLEAREAEGPSRQTSTGRTLRLVTVPTPAQRRPPVIPQDAPPLAVVPPPEPDRQLDLFAWTPRPAPPPPKGQLSLFPDDPTKP